MAPFKVNATGRSLAVATTFGQGSQGVQLEWHEPMPIRLLAVVTRSRSGP